MKQILLFIGLPLLILNWAGVIVGSIWLAILGEWGTLLFAILAMVLGIFACSFLLLPGLIFSAPGLLLQSKQHWLPRLTSYPLLALGALWTYFIMSAWAAGNLFYYYQRGSPENLIPSMLVAYGVATAPWSSMAQKESVSDGSSYAPMTAFFLQLASAQILVSLLIFNNRLKTALVIFLAIMAACLLFQAAVTSREMYLRYKINKMLTF
jgi:hypothetical protein